jgi:hypothetical protein
MANKLCAFTSGKKGQCLRNVEDEGDIYCKTHARRKGMNYKLKQPIIEDSLRRQQLEGNLESLDDEIRIARAMVETRLNMAKTDADLAAAAPVIQSLLTTIDKLLVDRKKMLLSQSEVLTKTSLLQLAHKLVDVISVHLESVPGRDVIIDEITTEFVTLIEDQRNEEESDGK